MKKIAFIFAALAICGSMSAQDRLSTTERFGISEDYYRTVEKKLGIDGEADWAFLTRPSFLNEWAVKCVQNDLGAELIATAAESSLWSAKGNKDNIPVITKSCRISRAQAKELDELFQLAVETSSYLPDRDSFQVFTNDEGKKALIESVGLDGTDFVFYSKRRAAEVWSPREGVCADLVDLGDSLYYAAYKGDLACIDRIIERAKEPKKKLRALLPDWYLEYMEAKANSYVSRGENYDTDQFAERSHMHVSASSNGYILEIGGKEFECDKETLLSYITDARSNSLLITDNGTISWADAQDMIKAVNAKRNGHATVITDESQNKYWKERGISSLLTVIPQDLSEISPKAKKLKDVTDKLNYGFTKDFEKDGKVILDPKCSGILSPSLFKVFEVIETRQTTLVLYSANLQGAYTLLPLDISIRIGDQTYKMTSSAGMEDWIDPEAQPYNWTGIAHCKKECTKVFCAFCPAILHDTESIDIIENGTGRVLVEGLQLKGGKAEEPVSEFKTAGRYMQTNTSISVSLSDGTQDTCYLAANSITCYKDKTVLTMTSHKTSTMGETVFMGQGSVLALAEGRKLKLLETNGKPLGGRSEVPYYVSNSIRDYVFQYIFEPMTDKEISKMQADAKKKKATLCRLSGPDATQSLFHMMNPDQAGTIDIDICIAK